LNLPKKKQPYIIEPIDINDFPIIKNHLNGYWDKLKKRSDKGDTPYNLRNCAYLEDFKKEKIIYNDISKKQLSFCYDVDNYYINNTIYFIKGKKLKYFTGVLNSKLIDWYYRQISSQLGSSSVRLFTIFMEKLPIPKIEKERQKVFETLVNYILYLHETKQTVDEYVPNNHIVTELEKVIDGCVYELYFEKSIKAANAEILDLAMDLFIAFPTNANDKTKKEIVEKAFLSLQASRNLIRNRLILQNTLVKEVQFINTNV
jgi:hypothetical protein